MNALKNQRFDADWRLYERVRTSATFGYAEGVWKTENTVTCEYIDGKLNVENEPTTVGFVLTTAFELYIVDSKIMDMKSIVRRIRNLRHTSSAIARLAQFFIRTAFIS